MLAGYIPVKRCSVCGFVRPLDMFGPDKRATTGRRCECNKCRRAAGRLRVDAMRAWWAKNHWRLRGYRQAAKQRNPNARKEYRRRYRLEHLEQEREHDRKRRDIRIPQCKAWRLRNLDYDRERRRRYYEEHPEVVAAARKRWAETHPDANRLAINRRRAARKAVGSVFTEAEWKETLGLFDHRCAYCGEKVDALQMEHVVPISKGGPHSADNIVPACGHCNASKGSKSLLVFLLHRGLDSGYWSGAEIKTTAWGGSWWVFVHGD